MTEWLTRQEITHPVRTAMMAGLATAMLLLPVDVIYEGGFRPSVVLLMICGFLGATIGLLCGPRPLKDAFPSESHIDTKMAVWRIVRDGGPVDDATTASAVAHHANWVLERSNPKRQANALGLMITLLLIIAVIFAINDEQPVAWLCVGLAVFLTLMTPSVARVKKHRRNAETVHARALQLLAASRAATPGHRTGNGSAPQGPPADG